MINIRTSILVVCSEYSLSNGIHCFIDNQWNANDKGEYFLKL